MPRVRPHSAQAWCGTVERRERSTCSRELFRIILRPIQFAPRSRKPRFIGSINVDGRGLSGLRLSISRRDVRVRIARATSRKLRTVPVTLPPREARKFSAFSNTEIVDPPFPNPRLRRGAPTRPPQNRRDPSKMTHTFFALAACLLVSFKGPFARRHAITRRKRCTLLLIRTRRNNLLPRSGCDGCCGNLSLCFASYSRR